MSAPSPPKSRPRSFTQTDSEAVYRLAESSTKLGKKVKLALEVLEQALDRYGLDHVALSFNGGKDCTVLIHLLAACILHHPTSTTTSSIPSVYIRCASPFDEVEHFVQVCKERYRLELEIVEGGMKEALGEYIGRKEDREKIEAVVVGTRRGDPHGELLTPFDQTDPDWPQFMRVHPILDWSYSEIWEFLRDPTLTLGGEDGQEWCVLYDQGYTSLGSTHNTFPNPTLREKDGEGWKPAWELEDGSLERAGRGKRPIETNEGDGVV